MKKFVLVVLTILMVSMKVSSQCPLTPTACQLCKDSIDTLWSKGAAATDYLWQKSVSGVWVNKGCFTSSTVGCSNSYLVFNKCDSVWGTWRVKRNSCATWATIAVVSNMNQCRIAGPDLAEETSGVIYPNPSSNEFFINVDLSQTPDLHIFVRDIAGKLVASYSLKDLSTTGNIVTFGRSLLPGIYIVNVVHGDIRYTKKIVKVE